MSINFFGKSAGGINNIEDSRIGGDLSVFVDVYSIELAGGKIK